MPPGAEEGGQSLVRVRTVLGDAKHLSQTWLSLESLDGGE